MKIRKLLLLPREQQAPHHLGFVPQHLGQVVLEEQRRLHHQHRLGGEMVIHLQQLLLRPKDQHVPQHLGWAPCL